MSKGLAVIGALTVFAINTATPFATESALQPTDSAVMPDLLGMSGQELLDLSLEDLLNIDVTTVTLGKQTLDEAPSSLVVIKAADIKRYGFRTLGEAINYMVAGADILTDYNYSDIGTRGLFGDINANGSSVRVLVDGIDTAFRTTGANAFGFDQIPIEAAEQIEVVRGPMSVIYGASAFLGVVNIITKAGAEGRAAGSWAGIQSLSKSGQGYAGVSGEFTKPRYFVGGSANVSGSDFSGLKLPNASLVAGEGRFASPDNLESRSFSGRSLAANLHAGVTVFDGFKVQVDGLTSLVDSSAQFQPYSLLLPKNRIANLRTQGRLTASYVWEWLNVEGRVWRNQGQKLDNARLDIGNADFRLFRNVGFGVWGGSVRVAAEPVSWFTGWVKAEYEREQEQMNRTLALTPGQQPADGLVLQEDVINLRPGRAGDPIPTITNTALSGYAVLTPLEGLSISGGARWDHHSIYEDNYSFRLGVVGRREGLGFAKLIAGRSFKAPTPQQLFWLPVGTADFQGNPKLRPQTATSVEVVVGSRELKVVTMQATAFVNLIGNRVIYLQRAGTFEAEGIANARTVGLEVEAGIPQMTFMDGHLRLYGNLALSWNKTTSELDEIQRSLLTNQNVLYPTWKASLVTSCEWRPWHAALIGRANVTGDRVDSQTNIQANGGVVQRVHGNRDVDLGLRTAGLDELEIPFVKGLELQFMVRNVLGVKTHLPGYNGFEIPHLPRTYELFAQWQF